MAEIVNSDPHHAVRLEFNGIKIELYPSDGSLRIFADPDQFDIAVKPGRGSGQSGRLFTSVVISPFFAQGTSPQMPPYNRETIR